MGRTNSTQRGASRRTTGTTAKRIAGGRTSANANRATSKKRTASGPRKPTARSPRASARSAIVMRPAGPWVPVIIVGLIVVLGWSLYPALRLQYQTSRRAAGLQQQYEALRQRNQTLSAEVADLKTPKGVEKAARERLGYTKRGENVYVVIPDGAAASSDAVAASSSAGSERPLIQALLDAVFGVAAPITPEIEP